jgi:ribosome biogenesis GTPase
MALRLSDDSEVRARIKGKKIQPVCGDRVIANPLADEPEWLITAIKPRDNELTRPDSRGRINVLAANLDFLAVVAAETPAVDWYIVDRYLAAARNMAVSAMVIFNKTDLAEPDDQSRTTLKNYEDIGYKTVSCSAKSGANLDQVEASLRGRTAIIVGQSGVGKSSLINHLIKAASQRVGKLSKGTGEGKHTTVNSVMLSLPGGGAVIDSPGVRDYAPAIEKTTDVAAGFVEIAQYGQDCKFANCRHLREPSCAVKDGVLAGKISARRYESYRRLLSMSSELAERNR